MLARRDVAAGRRRYPSAVANQYPETRLLLGPEIARVKAELGGGRPPSEIANELHGRGFGAIHVMIIFIEATGASLRDVKTFGQWWGHHGVTDPTAFDAFAHEVLAKLRTA